MTSEQNKILNKIITAFSHYLEGDPSLLERVKDLKSHCNGTDFSMPVEVVLIPADSMLTQMQASGKGMGETRQGNYYGFYSLNSPDDAMAFEANMRGIAPSTIKNSDDIQYESGKALTHFRTTKDIHVWLTTAQTIDDTWSMGYNLDDNWNRVNYKTSGGGVQIHVNDIDNQSINSLLKDRWVESVALLAKGRGALSSEQKEEIRDVIGIYAMVLYNRASFDSKLMTPAIDALIHVKEHLEGSKDLIAEEAIDITQQAVFMAIQKQEKLGQDEQSLKKVETIMNERVTARKVQLESEKGHVRPTPSKA